MKSNRSKMKVWRVVACAFLALTMALSASEALAIGSSGIGLYEPVTAKGSTAKLVGLTAKGKAKTKFKLTKTTINIKGKKRTVTTLQANAFKDAKATKIILPKTIKTIKKNAFKGTKKKNITLVLQAKACTKTNLKNAVAKKNIKTLVLNTKSLKKKDVKGVLKGSAVTTVKVPKSKLKAYKKYFTKANCGKKVTVKALTKKDLK